MDPAGCRCLVTGAAHGIGRATAWALAHKGARLVLCDVDRSAVDDLARELTERGLEAHSYGVDVADRSAMSCFASWVETEIGPIDVLVNNAGILRTGGLIESSYEDFEKVFSVHLWGVVHATKLFVPQMIERGLGAVVNIASASGRVGFSPLLAYSTSKFGVVGFSQALAGELAGRGVTVSAVCPGLVRTNIARHAVLGDEERDRLEELLERKGIAPERVARAVLRAIETGKAMVDVGSDARWMSWAARFFPNRAPGWVARLSAGPSKQ